jgi:hypothetical protein
MIHSTATVNPAGEIPLTRAQVWRALLPTLKRTRELFA